MSAEARTVLEVIRPDGRVGPGQYRWSVPQCEALVGRRVEVRDWYATFPAVVEGFEVSAVSGFVSHLVLTYQAANGEVTRSFSLNVTREIAIGAALETTAVES